MASEDVIELGSSDDEPEPPTKKKKVLTNAMVHIPENLHGVTIKPVSKRKVKPQSETSKRNVGPKKHNSPNKFPNGTKTVKISPKAMSNFVAASGTNVNHSQIPVNVNIAKIVNYHLKSKKSNVNPMNINPQLMKNSVNPINVIQLPRKSNLNPVNIQAQMKSNVNPINIIQQQLMNKANAVGTIQQQQCLNNLPSSITIKKTGTLPNTLQINQMRLSNIVGTRVSKRPNASAVQSSSKQLKGSGPVRSMKVTKIVPIDFLTVDDDDTPSVSTVNPPWYLRPEQNEESEETKESIEDTIEEDKIEEGPSSEENPVEDHSIIEENLKEQNNKEPEKSDFIEITIEDSPVKPIKDKCKEIESIAIEDSPVKPVNNKKKTNKSDEERQSKAPNSKKKLNYPKDNDPPVDENHSTIEAPEISTGNESAKSGLAPTVTKIIEIEIEDSPMKVEEVIGTPKKSVAITNKVVPIEVIDNEFHPVYCSFIELCFKLENTEDMKKIVEKKIKSYYKQAPKEYTESEEFIELVSSKIISMRASPDKMYLFIKDIVDELNLQRKMAKAELLKKVEENRKLKEENDKFLYSKESQFEPKRQRQIKKLEKTLKKLHKAIQKLEEQEVDFDDDDDSVYLLTERYKERVVKVHRKLCQLTKTKMPSEPHIVIESRPGQPTGPAKKLEKWVNKKVPIGTPLPFPDFHDVLRCVREANDADKLCWNEADIVEEARDLFVRCGKKLQRRRQENEWRLAASRISHEVDPAEESDDLKRKLEANKTIAAVKEAEVLNRYADKQNQLHLEPKEIGDKEAEESPVESDDDDETNDEELSEEKLEDKENRKERLKRLIEEKSSKKSSEDNSSKKSSDDNLELKDLKPEEIGTINDKDKKSSDTEVETVTTADIEKDQKLEEGKSSEGKISWDTKLLETKKKKSPKSSEVESDVDELHLLQKLHSGNEAYSSDCSYEISTLESSSETENPKSVKSNDDDVISIEDSSYSESECDIYDLDSDEDNIIIEKDLTSDFEIEAPSAGVSKCDETKENDGNDIEENILLESSEDEATKDSKTIHEKEIEGKSLQEDNPTSQINDVIIAEASIEDNIMAKSSENSPVEEIDATETEISHAIPKKSEEDVPNSPKKSSVEQKEENEVLSLSSVESNIDKAVDCLNLQDDNISIEETIIEGSNLQHNDQEQDAIKKTTEMKSTEEIEDTVKHKKHNLITLDEDSSDSKKKPDSQACEQENQVLDAELSSITQDEVTENNDNKDQPLEDLANEISSLVNDENIVPEDSPQDYQENDAEMTEERNVNVPDKDGDANSVQNADKNINIVIDTDSEMCDKNNSCDNSDQNSAITDNSQSEECKMDTD